MKQISMTRREFVRASGLTAVWAALAACGPVGAALWGDGNDGPATGDATRTLDGGSSPSGVKTDVPHTDVAPTATAWPTPAVASDEALLVHTVRRMSFGMSPGQLAHARDIGLAAYIEEQLNPESIDDSRAAALLAGFDVLHKSPMELLEAEQRGRQVGDFALATLARQRFSERQLYESVVDFWTNHFNIFIRSGPAGLLKIIDDAEVIRPNALGTFPALLWASAHSPAMLAYLDQASSNREHPNENYARELLELHTVGVDGGYTQRDVEEAARALTGWSIVPPRGRFRPDAEPATFMYRPPMHDDGEKRIMAL
ncbi:MAG: DUF1800 family protein, partial [Anaerolineales bacterium]